jgi:hypothetical protein
MALITRNNIEPGDDYQLASWIASVIDGVINTQGFCELEKPDAAIVMNNENRISMIWSPDLKIGGLGMGGKIKSFVYLNELHEFKKLKGSFGLI